MPCGVGASDGSSGLPRALLTAGILSRTNQDGVPRGLTGMLSNEHPVASDSAAEGGID
jgi:hypothetical protein